MTISLIEEIKQRIEKTIPGAQVDVSSGGDRHFSLTVIADEFRSLPQVKQHQLVYSAITDLMAGSDAPIHAIDRMNLSSDD